MNFWIGIGNLTDDPTMRYTESGKAVTSFSIAINNGRTPEGEDRPPTYIDVVAWEKLAENCAEYLRKGKKAAVSGPITVEKYTDKEDIKRVKFRIRAVNVEFLSPRSENDDEPRTARRSVPRDDADGIPF